MAVYECVLNWLFNANTYNTVLHYDDGGAGPPDFQGLTDDIFSKMVPDYVDRLVNDISWQSARWREDIAGGVGTVFFPTGGAVAGANSGSNINGQTAAIIRKLGAGLVRPNKGRIYQPGVASGFLGDNGLWAGAVSNALETFWETMMQLDDGGGVTVDMVIKASNPTAPNTQPYTTVSGMQALGNPGTQRRRRLGVGS